VNAASASPSASALFLPPSGAPTEAEASRFLAQAGFAATPVDIVRVQTLGMAGWLDEQFDAPRSLSHFDWLISKGFDKAKFRNGFAGVDATLWRKFIGSPDALRQRVVLALSEIFVISMAGLPVAWRGFAVAAYVDMLETKAFGSFRGLLEGVTLSCGMGVYLNMRGNQKGDPRTGRLPDENYAREVMQLFTIGLQQLGPDGRPRTDDTGPLDSYDQGDVSELAKVFTGWNFDGASATSPEFMRRPMTHSANRFAVGPKRALHVAIAATADGPTALGIALDTLADHPNVGPFIGRQLIQRLVCSDPSPAYVRRVAEVFADNGRGERGDLRAVLRAILLDPEAREPAPGPATGKLREPMLRFIQWARTVGLKSPNELWNVGSLADPAKRLGQSPLRSPSVFNFFRPGYVPPNTDLGKLGVTAPEFQLCNETSVAGYLNFMQGVINNGIGELKPDYTADLGLANDASALVERYALLLAANALSVHSKDVITDAVATIAARSDAGRRNRIRAATLLVMATPEYLIQQ